MQARHIIREWRRSRGLSQEEAAEQAGLSQAFWSKIEAGKQEPGVSAAVVLDKLTAGSKFHCPVEAWVSAPKKVRVRHRRDGRSSFPPPKASA